MAVCDMRAPSAARTPRPVCLPRGRCQQSLSLAPLDGKERQAQIADPVDQAVEGGLIGHLSGERRVAVRLWSHGKVIEPRGPASRIEDAAYPASVLGPPGVRRRATINPVPGWWAHALSSKYSSNARRTLERARWRSTRWLASLIER